MESTIVMSKEMGGWMKPGDGWIAIILGENTECSYGADDTHKIHYMHQVDDRKMGHAAKTR